MTPSDTGVLGMALDPAFPTNPYIYVLYTLDAPIGGTPPVWHDSLPEPARPDSCVVSARLSRLQAAGNVMTGAEKVLINDWCQQYATHSIGTVMFGADGALYASAGDGAAYSGVDYGQNGAPPNPCGDPPAPSAARRLRRPPKAAPCGPRTSSRPLIRWTLDGSIIRVDPATGAAPPDNPNVGSSNANARRIVATGCATFRMNVRARAQTTLWLGDVGWNTTEEIDRVADPMSSPSRTSGGPATRAARSSRATRR